MHLFFGDRFLSLLPDQTEMKLESSRAELCFFESSLSILKQPHPPPFMLNHFKKKYYILQIKIYTNKHHFIFILNVLHCMYM